jgi:parvulin-like peptidyl-prolyl isomerase
MNTLRMAAVAALTSLSACEGLRDAMTAHVDVAARAASQQLSVDRLGQLMGRAQIPVRKDVAQSIADVWVNYQLLAKAAANGYTFDDSAAIDKVMAPAYQNSKRSKWYAVVSQRWPIDTTNLEQKYNSGDLLAASHILFQVPAGQQATGSDSVRRRAESVLKQTTAANFAAMAKRHGSDGTKDVGGALGVWQFGRGRMIAEFENAVKALQPGEIGPLVQTQFGYHIVRRHTYAETKDAFRAANDSLQRFKAESAFVADVERSGKIEVKPNAAKLVKEVATDLDAHRDDRAVVATSVAGNYTAGQVAAWIASGSGGGGPPEQIRMQLQQLPDSQIPSFVKYLVRDQLFLRQADSAKIALDSSEVSSIRQAFRLLVTSSWSGLRILPEQLADSGKTVAERERIAAARVDAYLDRLLQNQEQYVQVQPPLAAALRLRYSASVNSAGLDRAVQAAQKIRAQADSARAAQQPKSAVPMPGAPTPPPPKGGQEKK